MRGRQRKYKTLEDSVDERNRKLEMQLFSTCREARKQEYRRFIDRYKNKASHKVAEDRTGSKYTVSNVLASLIFWDARIEPEYNSLTPDTLELLVQDAVAGLPPTTRNARCGVLKTFLKRINKPDLAKGIELVKTKTKIKIEELVSPDDVMKMLNACMNPRDRALISLIYESGARRGEILRLAICDATPEPDGYRIRLNGKTGIRRILVIDSAQYLHQWLIVHPCRADPQAPIFCTLGDGKRQIAVSSLELILKSAAKRAGIEGKRLNPHAFRHAQATEKSRYFTDSQLRVYLGWAKNSSMPSVYDHLKGESLDDDIRRHHGMLPKTIDPVQKAIECPRCHRTLPGDAEYCGYCMMPLSIEARQKMDASLAQDMQDKEDLKTALESFKKEKAELEALKNEVRAMTYRTNEQGKIEAVTGWAAWGEATYLKKQLAEQYKGEELERQFGKAMQPVIEERVTVEAVKQQVKEKKKPRSA
ncbi:site-specific integrase [uncultured Methanomethylovorans sp.]|uniref:tyrosine-type recombinase/integrase n=1 Tax=uncultured Methanomethylovorans sp. TaxID=183759 RepID=UPI00261C755F|nr:site-specific integrase [uncultured Methanomethylovorans sp.]